MARLFCEHTKRQTQSLNGAWRFLTDPKDVGESEGWSSLLPEGKTVSVPSVWNMERGLLTYEGVVWYEKSFYSEGGTLRFCFEAVMTEAKVWLDGQYLGSHYGGFCQFELIAPDVKEGMHTLTVRVDNRFDAQSIPQAVVDWYHYGGITRGVSVETLKGICVLSQRMEYTLSEKLDRATCRVVAELYNEGKRLKNTSVRIDIDGKIVCEGSFEVRGRKTAEVVLGEFELEDIRLWDIGKPELYTVSITTDTDDLIDRVGFRKVEVKDGKVLLNGRAVEFRGVNRHEEHPEFGFAFPPALMRRDLELALEMGCNAIRGSHYPNSKEFVDLLDETGVMFWSEIPIWGNGFSDEALADKVVVSRGLQMHREMLKYYYNHPCIVMWGMHNEIHTYHQAAYNMSKLYYGFLKENGGNRLVVYACDRPRQDICFEFCDVVCLNQYFGWYYGYEEDAWEKFIEEFSVRLESLGMGDKPIVMSEFGYAAMAGYHDDDGILWSEENQAKQLVHCVRLFHEHPKVVGAFIWQFCDIRTSRQVGLTRARGFNNKGIVNEYRKPKLAYYAVKQEFCAFAKEENK